MNTLVKTPLKKYKKGREILLNHATTKYHTFSQVKAEAFLKNYEAGGSTSINIRLDSKKQAIFAANKKRLCPIFKTALFCAQNNLPFRGHRDDGELQSAEKFASCLAGTLTISFLLLLTINI